jgi:hypothetical protein
MNPANFVKTLAWTDFTERDSRPPGSKLDALTKAKWPHSYEYSQNLKGKYVVIQKTFRVSVQMDSVSSWVVKDKESDSLLNHEQGHYNITALGARDYMNGALDLETDTAKELEKALGALEKSVQSQISAINKMYDEDPNCGTDHGSKADQQTQWDLRIKNLMNDPKGSLDALASCPAAATP